jgi:hypothetical protein
VLTQTQTKLTSTPDLATVIDTHLGDCVTDDGRVPGYGLNVASTHYGFATDALKRRWWEDACARTDRGCQPVVAYHDGERWRFMVALMSWAGPRLEYTAELYPEGFALHVRESLAHLEVRANG